MKYRRVGTRACIKVCAGVSSGLEERLFFSLACCFGWWLRRSVPGVLSHVSVRCVSTVDAAKLAHDLACNYATVGVSYEDVRSLLAVFAAAAGSFCLLFAGTLSRWFRNSAASRLKLHAYFCFWCCDYGKELANCCQRSSVV